MSRPHILEGRGFTVVGIAVLLLIALLASFSAGEDVLVPSDPSDPVQQDGGSDGSEPGQSQGGEGQTGQAQGGDDPASSGPAADQGGLGVPATTGGPEVPTVPGGPEVPEVPDDEGEGDGPSPPTETPPPADGPGRLMLPDDPWVLFVALVVLGVVTTYAPAQIRRMRIEAAYRESMNGRLALAKGEFGAALAAIDRAIEQAHLAYKGRPRPGTAKEWKLVPDGFYISLWRNRAAALRGLGRYRAAEVTEALAKELEATVVPVE